jgi:hypothetical protein
MARTRPVGLLAVMALVAACGSTGPTLPPTAAPATSAPSSPAAAESAAAPSPTEAPSPTPTAAPDVSGAFNAELSDPMWSPHITVKAVTTVGTTNIPMTGTIDVNLGTSHTVITTGQGSAAVTEETISNGATEYTRQYGAWFKSAATSGSLGTLVTGTKGFIDAGVETKDGQALHHMELPAGAVVPTDGLGVPAGSTDAQASIEAWADGEGNPVIIDVTASWNQVAKTSTVPVKVDMEFSVDGAAATISTPTDDDIWAWKTSSVNHYKIAYPTTWEYAKGSSKKPDYFYGYDGAFFAVLRTPARGVTLNELTTYARSHLATWTGLKNTHLIKVSAVRLSGLSARLLQFRGSYKGVTEYHYDAYTVKGNYVYEVLLSVPRKPTKADLAIWATLLATYKMK